MSDAPIYVYDGECVLCSRAVQYVLKHDRTDPPIRFVAILSQEGRTIAEGLGIDPENPSSFIFVDDGKAYLMSDAVMIMTKRAGGPARYLHLFSFVPRPLRDWGYKCIATNRYSWFGRLDNCYMPGPETRERFVLETE